MSSCRCGEHRAEGPAPAQPASVVPHLPPSDDGVLELQMLGKRIELHRGEPALELGLLLDRAAITGTLEDYQDALATSEAFTKAEPANREAWKTRIQVLTRIHQFAQARALLDKVDPKARDELAAEIDDASRPIDRAIAHREAAVKSYRNATTLMLLAATLAQAGRTAEARALIPEVLDKLRNNTPEMMTWLAFQLGRIYEAEGNASVARELYGEARARMPGNVEATAHLALEMIATGDREAARALLGEALAANPHPELLGIAAELDAVRVPEARAAWERYVAALPDAFADHAARFYLGPGGDRPRALVLAQKNLANRDTGEARALVAEAAMAARDPVAACAVVDPLIAGPATKGQQFIAWQALTACGRAAEADRLANQLGITK